MSSDPRAAGRNPRAAGQAGGPGPRPKGAGQGRGPGPRAAGRGPRVETSIRLALQSSIETVKPLKIGIRLKPRNS